MNDPNREAFEVAADLIGFRTDKINDSYIMLTQRAWRVWQAAKSHAAQEYAESVEGRLQERHGA